MLAGGGVEVWFSLPMKAYKDDHKDTLSLQVSLQSKTSDNTDSLITPLKIFGMARRTNKLCRGNQLSLEE